MTKKEREIRLSIPYFKGRKVELWITIQGITPKDPWLTGTVIEVRGQYLELKNVVLWNGTFHADYDVTVGIIMKIQLAKDPK